MKKISLLLIFTLSFLFIFSQSIVTRSTGTNTVLDSNLFAGKSFRPPVFSDTTSANTYRTLDSAGKIIFTRDINWYWGRLTSPSRKWVPFTNANPLTPNCGNPLGFHAVTWDSLLVFDVAGGPYTLCCDNIPRSTNDTVVTLPAADPNNPTRYAIILDSTGVKVLQGTAAADPSFPQLEDCQILLRYVLVNAGQTTPANITVNTIYDEAVGIAGGEWDTLAVTTNANFNNAQQPVHLTKDILVSSGLGYLEFTSPANINLNDYGALKLYIRLNAAVTTKFIFTWYLDGVQQTAGFQIPDTRLSYAYTANVYQTVVIPTSAFLILGTSTVNKLRISYSATNFYLDWIQLQTGIGSSLSQTFLTGIQGSGDEVTRLTITTPNSNPIIQLSLENQAARTIFIQDSSFAAQPHFGKLNLSHDDFFTNTLSESRITAANDGDILTSESGVATWVPVPTDTTFVKNVIYRHVDPNSNNDSLTLGHFKRDSATLVYDTSFLAMNSKSLVFQEGSLNFFKIQSNTTTAFLTVGNGRFEETMGTATAAANNLTLPNNGNAVSITGNTQINAITTANWQAGSQVELIFTGAPTVKNNTAGGAGTATILLAGSVDFTAAANDVLSLVYDGTNWHESARKTSATVASMIGRNGVTDSVDRIILGGQLYKTTTIDGNSFTLNVTANRSSSNVMSVTNTATTGSSFTARSSGTAPILGDNVSTTTNDVKEVLVLAATPTGVSGAAGLGVMIKVNLKNSSGSSSADMGEIIVKYTDPALATPVTQFSIKLRNTTLSTVMSIEGDGGTILYGPGIPSTTLEVRNTINTGIYSNVTSGTAIWGRATAAGTPGYFVVEDVSTNTVLTGLAIQRFSSGVETAGMGVNVAFGLTTDGGTGQKFANAIVSEWTDAADATRTSKATITGVKNAVTSDIIYFEGDKRTRFNGRAEMIQGADVASTGAMVLGSDGNLFEITGTADINTISNLTWQNGSVIYLQFTSTAKLKNGQATSGTDVTILLASAADFTGSANDLICLIYGEIGGTVAWREVSRSVN